ncbi:MAG: hypothetical protein NO117_05575 [Sulfolobales archaeon]|nr:hypothetical protein [Sulfolobales archaeon]
MRIPTSALLILLLVVIPAISLAIASASIGGITVLSPTQGQSFSAGQPLVLVVNATGYAGQVATVYVYNPGDSIVYSNTFQVPSNGILNATLFDWPATTSGKFPAGTYTIVVLIGSAAAASVQVYWAPGIANLVVTVVNGQTGLPLPNAPVSVYNASSNMLLASGITNSSGMVTLHVVAVPNVSETLKIIATPQGYPPQGVLYTVKGPGNYAVTLKVYPTSLALNVLGAYIGTVQVAPAQPSSVTASEGEPLSLIVQATYEGSPASNATVSATMQIGGTEVTGTVVPVGNGVFNVTFVVPSVGVPLSGYIVVTASYKGSTAQLNVPVVAQVNYGTYLNNISSSVAQVNETVAALQKELSAFNTTVTNVQKQLQSLSSQLSSLNSSIASLSSKLNQLSSQVSSLSSQLSSSQNMVYAGLIAGIIALIIAIVALVMVLRKIS